MKKRKEKTKSSSPLYEGCYCLQMIPLPMYQHNMSAFGQEQSPFMAKVQPTVPLQCEDPTWGHDMLLHGQLLLCVLPYCTCIAVAASFAWMRGRRTRKTYFWMPGTARNPRFNAQFGFITFIVFGFTSFFHLTQQPTAIRCSEGCLHVGKIQKLRSKELWDLSTQGQRS